MDSSRSCSIPKTLIDEPEPRSIAPTPRSLEPAHDDSADLVDKVLVVRRKHRRSIHEAAISFMSGKVAATVATDDWPVVFESLLLECPPRSAVMLLVNGHPDPIGPVGAQKAGRWPVVDLTQPLLAVQIPPLDGPLLAMRNFLVEQDGSVDAHEQVVAKSRRLSRKMHEGYRRGPKAVVAAMNDGTGWELIFCHKCKCCTFAASAMWNCWSTDEVDGGEDHGVKVHLCNVCAPPGEYVADCGRCEFAMFQDDMLDGNCRPQDESGVIWCPHCSVNFGSDFSGC